MVIVNTQYKTHPYKDEYLISIFPLIKNKEINKDIETLALAYYLNNNIFIDDVVFENDNIEICKLANKLFGDGDIICQGKYLNEIQEVEII